MPPFIDHVFGRVFAPPPMPPEAFPSGLLSKSSVAKEILEQAWRTMFFTTLTQGVILGALVTLTLVVGVVVRLNLRAAIKGAITDATR